MKINPIASTATTPTPQIIQTVVQSTPAPKEAQAPKAEVKTAEASALASMLRDVSLHYQVDPETQKIVVTLVDRQSKKVIRTIPPDELQQLGLDRTFEGLA
ncbi:MAG: flagellar protein FlaG [Chloroflexi bacterium]|nr:flagellar protein FlaG [Chloroflexota bacterium]